jgi:hypothetical protein
MRRALKVIGQVLKEAKWLFLPLGALETIFLLFRLTIGTIDINFLIAPLVFFFGLLSIEMIHHLTLREITDPEQACNALKTEIKKASNKISMGLPDPRIKLDKEILEIIKEKAKEGLWVKIIVHELIAGKFSNFFKDILSLPNFELRQTTGYFPSGRIVIDGLTNISLERKSLEGFSIKIGRNIKGFALAAGLAEKEIETFK